jgi:hypothetical protein
MYTCVKGIDIVYFYNLLLTHLYIYKDQSGSIHIQGPEWLNALGSWITYTLIHIQGPEWLNALGSWITYTLIHIQGPEWRGRKITAKRG